MKYRIISMNLEKHREDLLALWKEGLNRYSEDRFNWLYYENPYGQIKTLLAEDCKSNEIVGCGSIMLRNVFLKDEKVIQGVAIDFIVRKDHRTFGPALKIQRALLEIMDDYGVDFIFGFPNHASEGVFRRIGYKVIGEASNYVKLLHTETKLIGILKSSMLAKISGLFLDIVLWLIDFIKLKFKSQNYYVETVEYCDEKFDKLWLKIKKRYMIVGEKNSQYLNWRYSNCPKHKYHYFCLFAINNKELKGVIVYEIAEKVATIIDVFAEDIDGHESNLILEFAMKIRKKNVTSINISYFGNDSYFKKFKQHLFFKRPINRICLLNINQRNSEKYFKFLLTKNNWSLFDGELDL